MSEKLVFKQDYTHEPLQGVINSINSTLSCRDGKNLHNTYDQATKQNVSILKVTGCTNFYFSSRRKRRGTLYAPDRSGFSSFVY